MYLDNKLITSPEVSAELASGTPSTQVQVSGTSQYKDAAQAQAKELVVLDNIDLKDLKTKDLKAILNKLDLVGKVLFVTADDCENLYMASRNLGYTYVIMANEINCYDIVNADYLVCDEKAVNYIEEVLK